LFLVGFGNKNGKNEKNKLLSKGPRGFRGLSKYLIQNYICPYKHRVKMYLDPPNILKIPSQEVFGRLGSNMFYQKGSLLEITDLRCKKTLFDFPFYCSLGILKKFENIPI